MSKNNKCAGAALRLMMGALLFGGVNVSAWPQSPVNLTQQSGTESATTSQIETDEEKAETGEQETPNASLEGILIGTFQAASESNVNGQKVEPEGNGQAYVFGTWKVGPGTWGVELRAGTTPPTRGVTSFYGEVNDAVGETLDSNGDGRIAATQLFYALDVGGGELSVGLIDATGLLDANNIADDEYTQFLGTSYVNNPSIEYPSYALGFNYLGPISKSLDYQLFVSSTGGLEDEDDPTYRNTVDVGEHGKGVFVGGELLWRVGDLYGDVGAWYNGADHTKFNNVAADNERNYGAYASAGGALPVGQWVAWGGIANDKVWAAANFLALAYAVDIQNTTVGFGVSRIGVSDDLPEPADSIEQVELYWRFNVYRNVYVTPDLQYVNNSGFDSTMDGVVVGGLRAGLEF